jgi:hypothetical protein
MTARGGIRALKGVTSMKTANQGVPYSSATTGTKAREEIIKVLLRFGCESIGFMDEFERHEVLLAFTHRGRQVQLRASAKGWAQMFLKQKPWNYNRRSTKQEWEQAAPARPCCGHQLPA